MAAGQGEEILRSLADFAGQDHEELASAAGTKEDTRQPEFSQKGPRQNFTQ